MKFGQSAGVDTMWHCEVETKVKGIFRLPLLFVVTIYVPQKTTVT